MLSHTLLNNPPPINVWINNISINRVFETKLLGIVIDNTLKWKAHIDDVITKVSKLIGIIYRVRNNFSQDNIKLIYTSLVYPYFIYGAAVWGGAYPTYTQNLFITQKKLFRIMFHCHRYDHTNPYFVQHKLLKLPDIIQLQTGLFVYNSLKNNPNGTEFQCKTQNTGTRRTHSLVLPLCRPTHTRQSVLVREAHQWNQLPEHVRLAPSKSSFKLNLKHTLLNTYIDLIFVYWKTWNFFFVFMYCIYVCIHLCMFLCNSSICMCMYM